YRPHRTPSISYFPRRLLQVAATPSQHLPRTLHSGIAASAAGLRGGRSGLASPHDSPYRSRPARPTPRVDVTDAWQHATETPSGPHRLQARGGGTPGRAIILPTGARLCAQANDC